MSPSFFFFCPQNPKATIVSKYLLPNFQPKKVTCVNFKSSCCCNCRNFMQKIRKYPWTNFDNTWKKSLVWVLSLYVAVTSLQRFHAMIFGNICKKSFWIHFRNFLFKKHQNKIFHEVNFKRICHCNLGKFWASLFHNTWKT